MIVLTDGNIIHTILHATANVLMKLPSVISQSACTFSSACSILSFRQEADRRQYLCQSWRRFRTWSVLQDRQPHWHSNWAMAFPTSLRRRRDISWRHLLWQRFHGKKWAKWILPLIGLQYLLGAVLIVIAHLMNWGPF